MSKKYTYEIDGKKYEARWFTDEEINKKYAPFIYGFLIICILITVALELM